MTGQRNRAVLWDKMHLMLKTYSDRMMHLCYEYSGEIREDVLADTIRYMVDRVPVLHSRLIESTVMPYWEVADYDISDIFLVSDSEHPEEDANAFVLEPIPLDSNVQIRFCLFRKGSYSIFGLVQNHMCMDGMDLFSFLKQFFKRYNSVIAGEPEDVEIKHGSRSHIRMYDDLDFSDKVHARSLWGYHGSDYGNTMIPFSESSDSDRKMILHRELDAQTAAKARAYAKANGATFNDLLTAAYFAGLYEVCGIEREEPLSVSCAINLRRHIKDSPERTGYTNHTAWMNCRVEGCNDIAELLAAVRDKLGACKADKFVGMYSLPLLSTGFSVLPFGIAEKIAIRKYNNPPMSMSYVGRVKSEDYSLGEARMLGGYIAGTVKNKPQFILTVCAFDEYVSFSTAINGNDEDAALVNRMFDTMLRVLKEL